MKAQLDVAMVRSFASLLTSSGLRNALAMLSVWHRRRQPKMLAVNRFRSDYRLYFVCIACWSLGSPERDHEVCVSGVDAEYVACFCVALVGGSLQSPRGTNDRDHHLGYPEPRGFVPVAQRSSRKWLHIVGLAAGSLATVVRESLLQRCQPAINLNVAFANLAGCL